jgi:hypothetical protein
VIYAGVTARGIVRHIYPRPDGGFVVGIDCGADFARS